MTKVQFIKTEDGKELAVLPRDEYERLAARAAGEDVGTARLVRGARHALATGHEVALPKAVVDRLAAGENAIRVLREWRDVTQLYLMHKTNLSQSYLSDLETGRRKGSPETLASVARVLNVPLELLVRN